MATVVLAEDDLDIRTLVRLHLEVGGVLEVVAEAADGEAAVDACREHGPAAVLLDVHMPRLDGIGAIGAIREASPSTAIVMYSSDRSRREEALRAGADVWFDKASPVDSVVAGLARIVGAG